MGIDWNYLFTDTSGRIGRRDYWIGIAVLLVLHFLSYALFGGGLVGILARLVITFLGLAVMIKRCHDMGRTGWLVLLSFIPFIGTIFIIALGLIPGDQGANSYGVTAASRAGDVTTTEPYRTSDVAAAPRTVPDRDPAAVEPRRDV